MLKEPTDINNCDQKYKMLKYLAATGLVKCCATHECEYPAASIDAGNLCLECCDKLKPDANESSLNDLNNQLVEVTREYCNASKRSKNVY